MAWLNFLNNMTRVVAFDLDGTLAESKQPMTPAMAELLLKLPVVAVLSGASWEQFTSQFLSAFPAGTDFSKFYLFPDNAAQCFIFKNGAWEEFYNFTFSTTEVAEIKTAFANAIIESGLTQPPQLWGEQIEDRGAQISFSALGRQAPLEAKREWRAVHDAERSHLRDVLSKKLPNYSVQTGGETTIDITQKNITKAYGLQKLSEITGIPISDMMYVGDALQEGGNDYVVIETGVQTHQVRGPQDTTTFIQQLISS